MNQIDEQKLSFVLRHYRPGMFDTQKAWEKVSGVASRRQVRRILLWAMPAAAALILGVFFSWRNTWTEYNAYDLAQAFTLEDGTQVTLAPGATLRYQPHKAPRLVEMTGKVYYAVARDESHPFRVTAPVATVTVLGTVFQVLEDRVDVTEGRVRVDGPQGDGVILTAGQSAMLNAGIPVLEETALPNPSAWATGVFRYDATPLDDVLKDLSTYYGVPLQVKSDSTGKSLTGEFSTESLDEILELVGLALDVEIDKL
jgi:transmembrane sensor